MPRLEFSCQLRYPSGFCVEPTFTTDAPVTALFGPSGSGKTSVLSMIAGLRRPDAGLIRVGERLLFEERLPIDDRDLVSKQFFSFLLFVFSLVEAGTKGGAPILTIPAQ